MFGQTWPQNPSRTTRLVLKCRLHQKSARQTNYKAISWRQQILARLPSGTQNTLRRRSLGTNKNIYFYDFGRAGGGSESISQAGATGPCLGGRRCGPRPQGLSQRLCTSTLGATGSPLLRPREVLPCGPTGGAEASRLRALFLGSSRGCT